MISGKMLTPMFLIFLLFLHHLRPQILLVFLHADFRRKFKSNSVSFWFHFGRRAAVWEHLTSFFERLCPTEFLNTKLRMERNFFMTVDVSLLEMPVTLMDESFDLALENAEVRFLHDTYVRKFLN